MIKKRSPSPTGLIFSSGGDGNQFFHNNGQPGPWSSQAGAENEKHAESHTVEIQAGPVGLDGELITTENPRGLVLIASNDGSLAVLHRYIGYQLYSTGLAAIICNLLTPEEEEREAQSPKLNGDIGLLARRTIGVLDWINQQPEFRNMPLGCFGSKLGATAVLIAAAERPEATCAVVSCGGQPELSSAALLRIFAPVLLMISEQDKAGIDTNRQAAAQIPVGTPKEVCLIPGKSNLFEDPQASEAVVYTATRWFEAHLVKKGNQKK